MCLALPGKVKSIKGRQALVEYPSGSQLVLVGGTPIKIGDYVLVQMGIIIEVITLEHSKSIQKLWCDPSV